MIASDLLMDKVERLIIDDPYRKRSFEMSATDIEKKTKYNPITGPQASLSPQTSTRWF